MKYIFLRTFSTSSLGQWVKTSGIPSHLAFPFAHKVYMCAVFLAVILLTIRSIFIHQKLLPVCIYLRWLTGCTQVGDPGNFLCNTQQQTTTYYCQISNISCIYSQNLNVSRLVQQLSLPNPFKAGVNEYVVGAAPTGDARTTSEWSKILLHTKVCLILEVWW